MTPAPPEVRHHGSGVDVDRGCCTVAPCLLESFRLLRYTLCYVLFRFDKSKSVLPSHLHSSQKAALEAAANLKKQQRAFLRRNRGSHEQEVAAVTALNKAPPNGKLKSAKKASSKAKETTRAIKSSVSKTPPRPPSKAVASVTPEASDLPREIVTAAPSVPLDIDLEGSQGDFANCFDVDKCNDTLDQDDIDKEVTQLIHNSSSTDTENEDESTMSQNKSRGGDSVTTISKASLECLQNERNLLNEQLGQQLKVNKDAQEQIKSLKKALDAIASSEDGKAKSAEDALKISDLTSQLASLQEEYKKYSADTTAEIEALKKEKPAAVSAAALEKMKKKSQSLANELQVAKNEIKWWQKQNKSLKASLTKCKVKDGGNDLKDALAKAKKDLAREAKAKQALERDLRASEKANVDLKKELANAKAGGMPDGNDDTPGTLMKRIQDLEQELIAETHFKEKAISKAKDAVKEKDKALTACEELRQSNEAKRLKLEECFKVLREKGKAILAEVSPQVKQAARTELKEVVFRKVKIVNTKNKKNDEVKDLIKMVYNGIKEERMFEAKTLPNSTQKNPDYLTFEDFQRIYQKDILQYFSTLRSTVQTACKDAIMSKKCNFGVCCVTPSF